MSIEIKTKWFLFFPSHLLELNENLALQQSKTSSIVVDNILQIFPIVVYKA